jgi:hypothetical protein
MTNGILQYSIDLTRSVTYFERMTNFERPVQWRQADTRDAIFAAYPGQSEQGQNPWRMGGVSLSYITQLAPKRSLVLVDDAQRLQVTAPPNVLSAFKTYRCSSEGGAGGWDRFVYVYGVLHCLRGGVR